MDAAYAAQREFQEQLLDAGRAALERLEETGEPGLILLGRGYNMYDRNINCDIPRKLRNHYGANVIPLDFLVTGREPVEDLHPNMYWASGRKILEAARLAASRPNLHLIYISNFKCGPDSYIKYFTRQTAGAPLLVLQFDGHGNDAGYMTRCEAYLDSKGILRCYQLLTERTPSPKRRRSPSAEGQDDLHSADGARAARARLPRGFGHWGWTRITPPSDDRTLELGATLHFGRRVLSGQSHDRRLHEGAGSAGTDPAKVVFFIPTAEGPCRFGQYAAVPARDSRRQWLSGNRNSFADQQRFLRRAGDCRHSYGQAGACWCARIFCRS